MANVPPPMAFHTLTLQHNAIDVAVSRSGCRLAVLSATDLSVYALDMIKRPIPKPVLLWQTTAMAIHCPRHIAFVGDESIFCLTDKWDEDESYLWRSEGEQLLSLGPIIETEDVSSLVSDVDYKSLCIQFQNGALHAVDTMESSADLPPQTSLVHKLPSFAPEIRVVTIEEQVR
jgi:elongator complex protein 1